MSVPLLRIGSGDFLQRSGDSRRVGSSMGAWWQYQKMLSQLFSAT